MLVVIKKENNNKSQRRRAKSKMQVLPLVEKPRLKNKKDQNQLPKSQPLTILHPFQS